MKNSTRSNGGAVRDTTRHEIVKVNPLRKAARVVETVIGARKADEALESYKRRLTPAEIAQGDTYIVRSHSVLGSHRRLSSN